MILGRLLKVKKKKQILKFKKI